MNMRELKIEKKLWRAVVWDEDDYTSERKLGIRYERGFRYIDTGKLKHYLLLKHAVEKKDFALLAKVLAEQGFDKRYLKAKKPWKRELLFKKVQEVLRAVEDVYKYFEVATIVHYYPDKKMLSVCIGNGGRCFQIEGVSLEDAARLFRFETTCSVHYGLSMRAGVKFELRLEHWMRDVEEVIKRLVLMMLNEKYITWNMYKKNEDIIEEWVQERQSSRQNKEVRA